MEQEHILSYLRTHKEELFRRYGIRKMALFGSMAQGRADSSSDVDILIKSNRKDFFVRDALREHLESVFKRRVDIGYFNAVRSFYRNTITPTLIDI